MEVPRAQAVALRLRSWRAGPSRERGPDSGPVRSPPACAAPATSLYFTPNGDVRACCRNWTSLGNVGVDRLSDLWAGHRRRDLVSAVDRHDWSHGCEPCGAEVAVEGSEGSYPRNFDVYADAVGGDWPVHAEFNLSNACNLQCIQCDGTLSSAIRTHREHRPPLPRVYGDAFFADVAAFLPHLRDAQFAGGEPFLGPETLRLWDVCADVAPDLPMTVVTNATQWGARVERTIARHRMGFVFSLDGASATTFEAIRIGASFAEVTSNVERYRAAAEAHGMPCSVNHCLMVQNVHEFRAFLRWAEDLGMRVDVSVVRTPSGCSLAHLDRRALEAVHRDLLAQEPSIEDLTLNAEVWRRELDRIGRWAAHDDGERWAVRWETDHTESTARTIMDLPTQGAGPTDDAEAVAELTRVCDGPVHWVTVSAESGTIVAYDPAIATRFGVDATALQGGVADDLLPLLAPAIGTTIGLSQIRLDADRGDYLTWTPTTQVRSAVVALRREDGRAHAVRVHFGLLPG